MPIIPVLGKQRQPDLCEFKAKPGLQSEFQVKKNQFSGDWRDRRPSSEACFVALTEAPVLVSRMHIVVHNHLCNSGSRGPYPLDPAHSVDTSTHMCTHIHESKT